MGLAAACASCTFVQSVKDQVALKQQLESALGDSVNITAVDTASFGVAFVNSERAKLPAADRECFAREVAIFAYMNWPRRDGLNLVAVFFVAHQGPFSISFDRAVYSWKVAELRGAADSVRLAGGTPSWPTFAKAEVAGAKER